MASKPGDTTSLRSTGAPLPPLESAELKQSPRSSSPAHDRSSLSSDPVPGGVPPKSKAVSSAAVPPPLQLPPVPPAVAIDIAPSTSREDRNATEFVKFVGKVARIFQHFAIRTPHIGIAMAGVYLITKYYFNLPTLANDATLFVGTAGAVYCFLRPFFLTTIPYSVLGENHKLWREGINNCNTVLLTLTLTKAVWNLNIPWERGVVIWAVSFGLPFKLLSGRLYPKIDAEFKV